MSVNIDSLNLQISAESSAAEKSLNRLLSTLGRIKGAVEKASSLSSVTRRLNALNKAAKSLSTLDAQTEKINKLVSSLRELDTLKGVSVKPFIKSAEMLPSAIKAISDTDADTDKILGITNALKSFSNFGKNNINPFITSAERLPNLMKSLSDMPDIDSGKIMRITSTLQTFEGVGKTDINPFINSAKRLPEAVSALNNMEEIDVSRLNQVVNSLRTFETLGKNNINPFLNSLKKIPKIADDLKNVDFDSFAQSIQRTADAVKPLATEMEKVSNGFSSLPAKLQQVIKSNQGLSASNQNVAASKNFLIQGLTAVKIKLAAYGVTLKKVSSILSDYYIKSNEYIEDINLFTVAMGDAADESFNFAQKVNNLMSIDISEWVRNQGVFKSIASGFGVVTEKANLMSKNLTQIAYDISSFYNIDIDKAMTKVQSGISGELEPLRRLGYALDVATLQQVAYSHGITDSISKMTQAQKSLIRYVAIMEQSKNVMGDMSRTITTPANSLRILEQQFEQLKRAIGNIVSVLVAKLIPYIQAFVRLATEAAEALAKAWGFELPEIDYSGLSVDSVTDGVDDLNNALDDTADSANSAKKAMQRLAGFDEINVLKNDTEKSDSNKINTSKDLDIELPEYDFLSGLDESSNKIYEHMKKFFTDLKKWVKDNIPFIKRLAEVIATIWVISKIKKFWDYLKQLWTWFKNLKVIKTISDISKNFITGFKNSRDKGEGFFTSIKNGFKNIRDNLSTLQKFAITAATTILGAFTAHDFFYNMTKGTLNAKNGFLDIIGMAGSIGTAFALTGPVGGVITTLGVVVGGIKGWIDAQDDLDKQFAESLIYNNGGTKIGEIADAFEDTFKKIKDNNDVFINAAESIDKSKDSLYDTNKELEGLISQVESGGTKIEEAIPDIKKAFEDMRDRTKEVLGEIQTNVKNALTGGDMNDALAEADLNLSESLSAVDNAVKIKSQKVDEYQKKLEDLIKKYNEGKISEQEFTKEINNLRDEYAGLLVDYSQEQTNFINDLDTVRKNFDKIDFGDENEVKESISKIGTAGEDAIKSVKEKWDSIITQTKDLMAGLDTNSTDYKVLDKLLDSFKYQRDKEVSEIASEMDSFYSDVLNQIKLAENKAKDEYWNNANIGDWISYSVAIDTFQIPWNTSYEDYVKSKTDEVYGNIYDIVSKERAKISTDVNEETKKTLSGIPEAVKQSADDVKTNSFISSAIEGMALDIIDKFQSSVKEASKGKAVFPQPDMSTIIPYLSKNGTDMGVSLYKGYLNEINKAIPKVTSSTGNMAQSGIDSVKKTQDSHSPSKEYAKLGLYAIQGYCNGITNNLRDITTNATKIATTAISAVSAKNDFKMYGKKVSDTFAKGIDVNNITVTFVSMFDVILQKMQIFSNNLSETMNTNLTNMVNSVNSVKLTNGTATIGSKMPMIIVPKMYASGGYPESGEMFMARENGAELVGRIGNKTAVVNNEQIVESIKGGVYEAVMSAKSSDNSDNQPMYIYTTVYLDNDEVYNSVEKRSRREFIRSNGRNKVN